MTERDRRAERDAELWRRLREEARAPAPAEGLAADAPDEMALAAYLDGTLDPPAREALEARLAAAPEALDLLLAARAALAEPDAAAPESLVRRASALVADPPGRSLAARLRGLFAPLRQPLGWSAAAAGVLVACVVGFQLGQIGYASSDGPDRLEVAEAVFGLEPDEDEIL
jgi:hypothetical protein